eukprot:TRINITY_DN2478_c1_g3_i1.p1 TRINITY_DN2478_c1_g3~~TRINITY_DN2478_c1_g3_i1.p1  ORF type:complete len:161 (-),score=11.65 TRINITY_DN2478_c1_g3_i1:112-594(-)
MLQSLIDRTTTAQENCTLDEYLHGEDDLPVCVDLDNDSWDDNFLVQLGHNVQEINETDESDKEIELDDESSPLKVQSFKESINPLKEVGRFLKSRGCFEVAMGIGTIIDTVASLQVSTSRQSYLPDLSPRSGQFSTTDRSHVTNVSVIRRLHYNRKRIQY